jgi:hypothetical protein
MSHYTIDYKGLSEDEKKEKAMNDIKFYLGSQFDKSNETLKQADSFDEFNFCCEMIGITGYPVEAWFRELHPKKWMPDFS